MKGLPQDPGSPHHRVHSFSNLKNIPNNGLNNEEETGSDPADNESGFLYYHDERHRVSQRYLQESFVTMENERSEVSEWRFGSKTRTANVALVLCLNVGVEPPDVVKYSPCAKEECWFDPSTLPPQKSIEKIGNNLKSQYERWQPKARYKLCLDPTSEEVKKVCMHLRRAAKSEHVLFHYNGHGVPRPTASGEIWVFNKDYTQYIPLSIVELHMWIESPTIYVLDCSGAGLVLSFFDCMARQRQREVEQGDAEASTLRMYRNNIFLCACAANETLPQNPQYPADVFTACLTTPIRMAVAHFCISNNRYLDGTASSIMQDIPGRPNDRRTPLGELTWIFTAITDTIAWNILDASTFQRLFRQDLMVSYLFRNYLLAERVMHSLSRHTVSYPVLPKSYNHHMWQSWDLAVDQCLSHLLKHQTTGEPYQPAVTPGPVTPLDSSRSSASGPRSASGNGPGTPTWAVPQTPATPSNHKRFSQFFADHLQAFDVWLQVETHTVSSHDQIGVLPPSATSGNQNLLRRFVGASGAGAPSLSSAPASPLRNPAPAVGTILRTMVSRSPSALPKNALGDDSLALTGGHGLGLVGPPPDPVKSFEGRYAPEDLPIVLQVLLSQQHRETALKLISRFTDLGSWAVSQALFVGMFPYVLKLLQSPAEELRQYLIFTWTKILSVDRSCQGDLCKDSGHVFFITALNNTRISANLRGLCCFILSVQCDRFEKGQKAVLGHRIVSVVLSQITESNQFLRKWSCLLVAKLLGHGGEANLETFVQLLREDAPEKLELLLRDKDSEVRASVIAVYTSMLRCCIRLNIEKERSTSERGSTSQNDDDSGGEEEFGPGTYVMSVLAKQEKSAGSQAGPHATKWGITSSEHPIIRILRCLLLRSHGEKSSEGRPDAGSVDEPAEIGSDSGSRKDEATGFCVDESEFFQYSLTPVDGSPLVRRELYVAIRTLLEIYPPLQSVVETKSFEANNALSPAHSVQHLARDKFPELLVLAQHPDICTALIKVYHQCGLDPMPEVICSGSYTLALPSSRESTRSGRRSGFASAHFDAGTDDVSSRPSEKPVPPSVAYEWCKRTIRKPLLTARPEYKPHRDSPAVAMKTRMFKRIEALETEAVNKWHSGKKQRIEQIGILGNASTEVVTSMLFHPLECHLIVGDAGDTIHVWNWLEAKSMNQWRNGAIRGSCISCLEWINGGVDGLLLVGADDGSVRVWRGYGRQHGQTLVTAFRAIPELRPGRQSLLLHWDRSSGLLYAAGGSAFIRVWDIEAERCVEAVYPGCDHYATSMAAQGSYMCTGFADGTLALHDRRSGTHKSCARFKAHQSWILKTAMLDSPGAAAQVDTSAIGGVNEPYAMLSASTLGDVCIWDIRTMQCLYATNTTQKQGSHSGAAGADSHSTHISPGTSPDLRGTGILGEPMNRLAPPGTGGHTPASNQTQMVAFAKHSSQPLMAAGYGNQMLRILDSNFQQINSFLYHDGFLGQRIGSISCIQFHPYKALLATGTMDSLISIYGENK